MGEKATSDLAHALVAEKGAAPSRLWRRMSVSASGAAGVAFLIAQAAVGVANFGFHVLGSRMLGPGDYGALGSLLVILAALTVPVTVLETLVTARVARAVRRGEPIDCATTLRRAMVVGALVGVVMLGAAPVLGDYLHLDSLAPLLWLAACCVPLSAVVVPSGMVCGQQRFATAGAVAVVSAVVRLGLAAVFIGCGFGIAGAIAASVCADTLRALLLTAASRYRRLGGLNARPLRLGVAGAASGIAGFAGLWLLIGVDTMIARHHFDADSAGRFAAAATLTQGIILLAQMISVLQVPRFATEQAGAMPRLRQAMAAVGVIGLCATACLVLLSPSLLPWLLGAGFVVERSVVALLGLASTALAVVWVLLQFHLARGTRAASPAWYGLLIVGTATATFQVTPVTLATVMIVAGLVAAGLSAAALTQPRPAEQATPSTAPVYPVDLTVVVPFHNPGQLLRPNMIGLLTELRASKVSFEIIAVEDGCTDGSAATIADLDPATVRCLSLPRNQGKGTALRLGLREGRGRYVGFIDADGDLDPALWWPFLTLIQLYQPDAVIGSKCHPLSEIDPDVPWTRRLCSVGYRALVRVLFPKLNVRDTQVGIKVFRRELLRDVLPHTVERRFVIDLELLLAAHRLGYRRIMTAPVALRRQKYSTVTLFAVWRMLIDTLALWVRTYVLRAYDSTDVVRPAGGFCNGVEPDDQAAARIAAPKPHPAIAEVF